MQESLHSGNTNLRQPEQLSLNPTLDFQQPSFEDHVERSVAALVLINVCEAVMWSEEKSLESLKEPNHCVRCLGGR